MSVMQETNWGFDPSGENAGLGGESSPSMPYEHDLGLGNPKQAWALKQEVFVKEVKRSYDGVSGVKGEVWDPRGHRALTNELADFRKEGFNPFKENRVLEDRVPGGAGEPEIQQWEEPTDKHLEALNNSDAQLSAETVAQMAEVLEQRDSSVLSSIYLPQAVELETVDAHGFLSRRRGAPSGFVNPATQQLYNGLRTSIDSVIEKGTPPLQTIDENGFAVNKYASQTGPYDSFAQSLPGGFPTTLRTPTPSEVQADSTLALQAAEGFTEPDRTVAPAGDGVTNFVADNGVAPAVKAKFPWLIVLGAGTAFAGIMLAQRN